jgi:hypothetical protein
MVALCFGGTQGACVAERLTERLIIREGPLLNYGRMSAYLGAVALPDKRVVVVGGSDQEFPFKPLTGTKAIEILSADQSKWELTSIDVPYELAGRAFLLEDQRLLVFSSGFQFDADSDDAEGKPIDNDDTFTSAPVAAALIDLAKQSVEPIYRPKRNGVEQPPIRGAGPVLLQRAFDTTIQLRDKRIVRIGGFMRYQEPAPTVSCEAQRCRYCERDGACSIYDATNMIDPACEAATDCPQRRNRRRTVIMDDIEVYSPPTPGNPLGVVRTLKMKEGRSAVAAVQLEDSRLFITGGWGPQGEGANEAYATTYFLDTNTLILTEGPRMTIPREDHAMALLQDGRVLITGGTGADLLTVNSTEIFDPKTGQFINGSVMTESREDHIPIRLGPWVVKVGGEVSERADQIRNTAEAFSFETGQHVSAFLLFSRRTLEDGKGQDGYAGITDGAAVNLDPNTLVIFGGQQGLQEESGDYISAGFGSRRTLLISMPPQ